MFSFNSVVSKLLLEVDPNSTPQNQQQGTQTSQAVGDTNKLFQDLYNSNTSTFKNLKTVFDKKFGLTNLQLSQILDELNKTVPGGKYNIAAKYLNDTFIPFIDAFALSVAKMTAGNVADKKPTMAAILQNILSNPESYNEIFNSVAEQIESLPRGTRPIDYSPSHPNVINAVKTLRSQTEKLSQVALESLFNENIASAVEKIIAKRINVFDAIGRLKGARRPFSSSVIRPILLKYRDYINVGSPQAPGSKVNWEKVLGPLYGSWQKSVPGDFNDLVDDVSADNLLTIAVHAGDYYLSLLRNVIVDSGEQEAQNNENWNFDKMCDFILHEAIPHKGSFAKYQQNFPFPDKMSPAQRGNWIRQNVARTRTGTKASGYKAWSQGLKDKDNAQNQQDQQINKTPEGATPLTQVEYDDIARNLGQGESADHRSFIINGTSRYLGKTVYNLGTINKDTSTEAQNLIKALRDIAAHTKKGPSNKERLDGLKAGLKGIWAMSGHSLYN